MNTAVSGGDDRTALGPFSSRDEAIAHAVDAAKATERADVRSEVSWDDPDDGAPAIYKSGSV